LNALIAHEMLTVTNFHGEVVGSIELLEADKALKEFVALHQVVDWSGKYAFVHHGCFDKSWAKIFYEQSETG
jgi:hypothetical protein